jgi:hypothetical protein
MSGDAEVDQLLLKIIKSLILIRKSRRATHRESEARREADRQFKMRAIDRPGARTDG